tara:strand:+ start:1698 stop:2504 length:807 start_codon:yes stop_codon:yes gene_type:complete
VIKKVIVISPSPFSRFTLATLYLFERNGIEVSGVIINKLFNLSRLKQEIRRDGFRLVKKIFRKLILRSAENPITNDDNIISYMAEEGMTASSVNDFCKRREIAVFQSANLNDTKVADFIKGHQPDCIAFTGGGLIKENIIQQAGLGVVNCHMGILPQYRGMDVVEWPILRGNFDQIGMTTHLMNRGIDTGNIIQHFKIDTSKYSVIGDLRNGIERQMPGFLVDSCVKLMDGSITPFAQKEEDGIQHYTINKRLCPLIDQQLFQESARH